MKLLIATKNQGKIEGAKKAFEKFFKEVEILGIPVESNVSEQPVNNDIYLGAKNRVNNLKEYAKNNNIKADFYLSIESGIHNFFGSYMITNIAIVEDNFGLESVGTSASFPVPDHLVDDVINTSLQEVANNVFYKDDQRSTHGGIVQSLTHNNVSRIDLTESAFIMALTKHTNGQKWQ